MSRRQLVEQARSILGSEASFKLTILDGAEVDGVKGVGASVAAEEDWVLEVHGHNLSGHVHVRVGGEACGPVVGDLLLDKERSDGGKVRLVAIGAGWHELVKEAGGSVKQKGQRPEEEVGVLSLWGEKVESVECK